MGFSINKLSLIPNFVDCDLINTYTNFFGKGSIYQQLNISRDSYIITMIGRLIPAKRFDKFIEIIELRSKK